MDQLVSDGAEAEETEDDGGVTSTRISLTSDSPSSSSSSWIMRGSVLLVTPGVRRMMYFPLKCYLHRRSRCCCLGTSFDGATNLHASSRSSRRRLFLAQLSLHPHPLPRDHPELPERIVRTVNPSQTWQSLGQELGRQLSPLLPLPGAPASFLQTKPVSLV